MRLPTRARTIGEKGVSAVEVIIGLLIFSTLILAASAATTTSSHVLQSSQRDTRYWAAVQFQAETFFERGHDDVTSGSGLVQGYAMSWQVTEENPKRVLLLVERMDHLYRTVEDSLVLYLADRTP